MLKVGLVILLSRFEVSVAGTMNDEAAVKNIMSLNNRTLNFTSLAHFRKQ